MDERKNDKKNPKGIKLKCVRIFGCRSHLYGENSVFIFVLIFISTLASATFSPSPETLKSECLTGIEEAKAGRPCGSKTVTEVQRVRMRTFSFIGQLLDMTHYASTFPIYNVL